MAVRNFEIFNIALLIAFSIDYYFKYRKKFNRNSYLWFSQSSFILILSLLNIFISMTNSEQIIYYLLFLAYTFAIIPMLFLGYYVQVNYLAEKRVDRTKLLYYLYFLLYLVLVLVVFDAYKVQTPLIFFTQRSFYNILLIPVAIPIIYVLGTAVFGNKHVNNRFYITLIIPLLGVLADIFFENDTYITMSYTISILLLYMYKYDIVMNTDALTGAYNRRYLDSLVMFEDKLYGLFMIDVDKFKFINDTYGHDKGDIVLKDVVNILLLSSRSTDSIIRLGGDEFLIVASIHDKKDCGTILKRIENEISKYNSKNPIQINLSIGHDVYSPKKNLDIILKNIDEKMYNNKRSKKNEKK